MAEITQVLFIGYTAPTMSLEYLILAGGGGGGTYTGSSAYPGPEGAGGYRCSLKAPDRNYPLSGDPSRVPETPLIISLRVNYSITVGGGLGSANGGIALAGGNFVLSSITSTGGGGPGQA